MIEKWIEELQIISKHYKVKVNFSKKLPDWVDGLSHKKNGFTVSIKGNKTQEQIVSTFFHELGHVYCKRNKIWNAYHQPHDHSKQRVRRTALKAELWIDRWAIKEMNKWFPDLKYTGSYINMKRHHCKRIFYKNYLNKHFTIINKKVDIIN